LFALYVTGYSAFRIFEETQRIDSSVHFFGLRLNFYIATILTITGIVWFIVSQRGKRAEPPPEPAEPVPSTATETTSNATET
jgi:prolipoprotein diacylglyceryltransferase